jgi:cysteine-rich secretory family protein
VRWGRAHWGLLAAALVGVVIAVVLPPFPAATASSSDESRLVSLTNGERSNRGIRTLSVASDLTSIARRHSSRMASQRRIYHDSNLPNEVSGWTALGENVGRGSSASSVHQAFMGSGEHRAHILSTTYNQMGIGAVRGSDGQLYVTEVFARRGTIRTVHRVARNRAVRRARHRVHTATAKPRLALIPNDRSVGILLQLLAMDHPDTARKDIGKPLPAS